VPTRLQYRQAAARALGSFYTGPAAGGTTAYVEMATWPFRSTIVQNERFEHWILHRPGAVSATDRTRTVTTGGYDPVTGRITVDLLWGSAIVATEVIELIGTLDPDNLHRLVNAALKLTPVTAEVTFTVASTTARRHSLATAAPWLSDPDDVVQVGYLAAGENRADVDPFARSRRGTASERGGVVYLEGMSFNTTDTVYVLCARPAYSFCRASGGAYGDLTSGLTAETDEAAVEEDWVAAGVKMLAWDEFRELFWPGEQRTADQKVAVAAARFWALTRDNWRPPERRLVPLVAWGVSASARVPV